MGSEKLGTCDNAHHDPHHPHSKGFTCVNWREQPQGEATVGKDIARHRLERNLYALQRGKLLPYPDEPAQTKGGEKPEPDTDIELTTEQLGRIGQRISRMCEHSSPPATAAHNKYFVDRTPEGWGIFYTEPAAPETGQACIGGSKDEHIARLRCQILNSHISDVLEAVEFAKTQERLTERCQCVGEWKAGCPVHDGSAPPREGG